MVCHLAGAADVAQTQTQPAQAGPRTVSLGQVPGLAVAAPEKNSCSSASPSGFTLPIHGSEDSSTCSRRLSSVSQRPVSLENRRSNSSSEATDPLRRALQQSAALNAANAHILHLLSPGASAPSQRSASAGSDSPSPEADAPQQVRRITGGHEDGDERAEADVEAAAAAAPAASGGGMASPFGDAQQQATPEVHSIPIVVMC